MQIKAQFIWHRLIVSIFLLGSISDKAMAEDASIRQITSEDGALYDWLRCGSLFYQSRGPAKKGTYLFRFKGAELHEVTNLNGFSEMIREQNNDAEAIHDFIRIDLPRVFLAFFGPMNSSVIDKDYLLYRSNLPDYAWKGSTKKEIKTSETVLKQYEYAGPIIYGNGWSCVFYDCLNNGGIEKRELNGKLVPFDINSQKVTLVLKEGSVVLESNAPSGGI
jgi:hypothetical protein